MEFTGTSRPPSSSLRTAEISRIISSAMRSVHFAQASTTLLYFSPWVIRPSLYCCSYSFTSERVSSTIFHFEVGTTMSSLPKEMRSEEHTSELQSHLNLVCRLLLEKKKSAAEVHRQYDHCAAYSQQANDDRA